jgi:hypothetical protein
MIVHNGNVVVNNGRWIIPTNPPEWYNLSSLLYTNFDVKSSLRCYTRTPAVNEGEIRTGDEEIGSGNIILYKTILIPEERRNDDYMLVEIPIRPWRTSDSPDGVMYSGPSNLALTVRRSSSSYNINASNNDFVVQSSPLSSEYVYRVHAYGVEQWKHIINSYSFSEEVNAYERNEGSRKVRLLYKLKTDDVYISWGTNLRNNIILSDYSYLGKVSGGIGSGNYYTITIYANGTGWNYPSDSAWFPESLKDTYEISGYWSELSNCAVYLKSCKGIIY